MTGEAKMNEHHGVKGGEGTIGSVSNARSEKQTPCDCDGCTSQRIAYMIEAERSSGTLGTLPFPNAPTTKRLQ